MEMDPYLNDLVPPPDAVRLPDEQLARLGSPQANGQVASPDDQLEFVNLAKERSSEIRTAGINWNPRINPPQ